MTRLALTMLRVAGVAVVLMLGFMWWGEAVRRDRLFAPVRALGITEIVYVAETDSGIGPGDHESGVRLFVMPERMAEAIAAGGINHLNALPTSSTGGAWDWKPTPVRSGDADWPMSDGDGVATLADVMERYWSSTEVTDAVRDLVDGALVSPGSYYAFDGNDLFVMIPDARRLVFAYGG